MLLRCDIEQESGWTTIVQFTALYLLMLFLMIHCLGQASYVFVFYGEYEHLPIGIYDRGCMIAYHFPSTHMSAATKVRLLIFMPAETVIGTLCGPMTVLMTTPAGGRLGIQVISSCVWADSP